MEKLLASDLKQARVDYGGTHPYETRRRKLDEEIDPSEKPMEYSDFDRAYESLRIKYILDPIEALSSYYDASFDQVLPDVSTHTLRFARLLRDRNSLTFCSNIIRS